MSRWLFSALCFLGLCGVLIFAPEAIASEVVLYASHDEMFSAPIIRQFEEQSGIKVRTATDTEVSKVTGLVNRLIAEKERPRADVFWSGEVAQTIVLKQRGVLEPYHSPQAAAIPAVFKDAEGYWTGFGARGRVIIYNTTLVDSPPTSIFDLTGEAWRGQVGIALPLFGTTATHAAALFSSLGDDKARQFFRDLKQNGAVILDGNATVRDRVAQGQLKVGLTDTDDANGAVVDGKPAKWLFPDQGEGQIGTLVIPNTVCLIKNGPNPDNGKQLVDFMLTPEIETQLAKGRSLQFPVREEVPRAEGQAALKDIKFMDVKYEDIADRMQGTAAFIQEEFSR